MSKYIIKRILVMIPVFFGMTALVFFLSNMTPGSPVDAMITPEMSVEDVEVLRHRMGLDQPVYVQYVKWLGRMLEGNLGNSYRTSNPVIKDIGERVVPTLILTLTVLAVGVVVGVTLGVLAACRPYSIWDTLASGLSFVGSGMPGFFIALLLVYCFSVKLGWLPTGGMYSNAGTRAFGDLARHMVLPTISMAMASAGNYIRQTRSAMLEVMGEEYVKMARAKGMREPVVLYVHALRNALLPIVTSIGMSVPGLVGGAVIIEQIFGWPGMGTLMVLSVTYRDYPVIMGITMYITIAVLFTNLVMDLLYSVLDPRIRN